MMVIMVIRFKKTTIMKKTYIEPSVEVEGMENENFICASESITSNGVEDITYGQDMGYIRESELDQKVLSWLREKITVEEVPETEGVDYTETEAETE